MFLYLCSFSSLLFAEHMYAQEDSVVADHFQKGQAAAARLDYDRAIAEFRAVLKIDPTLIQARANLGLMYYSISEYGKAADELSPVTRSEPKLLPAQLFLGLADLKLGKVDQAASALQSALQLDPNNSQAARGLLACYVILGKYGLALRQLEFFKRQLDEESLFVVGQAYLDMGNGLTKRLASTYRDSAWAHQLAGDLASDRNDAKAAADEHAKAHSIDSVTGGTQLSAAGTQDVNDLAAALEERETAERLYLLIRATTKLGEESFENLQTRFPDSTFAHQLRGDVYRLRQDFPSALVEFQAALQKRGDDAALHQSVGEMSIQLHRLDDAEGELEQASKLNRHNAETDYLLGQVFTKKNQLEIAARYLREAVHLDPGLLQARALLGTTYMHLGKAAQAAPELEKALPLDYYGDLHFQLYRAYKDLGQTAAAEKALTTSKQLREKTLHSAVARISQ